MVSKGMCKNNMWQQVNYWCETKLCHKAAAPSSERINAGNWRCFVSSHFTEKAPDYMVINCGVQHITHLVKMQYKFTQI